MGSRPSIRYAIYKYLAAWNYKHWHQYPFESGVSMGLEKPAKSTSKLYTLPLHDKIH
jgi:hypothetical protein